ELGASLLANGVEDRIVKYVAGASANGEGPDITVAPALLSLVLRELNERRLRGGPDAKITPDLLDLEQEKILEDFYLRTLEDFPGGVRTFVEDKLLTAGGHRNSCALDDALTRPDVTQPILNQLVDRRLLAYEDRHNTRRVEITHDVLLPVIKTSRDIRLTSEARAEADRLRASEAAQRRKQQITTAVACALALLLIATVWVVTTPFSKNIRLIIANLPSSAVFRLVSGHFPNRPPAICPFRFCSFTRGWCATAGNSIGNPHFESKH